jgi:response regulator RpfG family c-di-GMP phosphodiesterase
MKAASRKDAKGRERRSDSMAQTLIPGRARPESEQAANTDRLLVTLTVLELEARIEDSVQRALAKVAQSNDAVRTKRARLTVRETAHELRCSERKVHRLIKAGVLHSSKLGSGGSSRNLISAAEVERVREGGV